MFAKEHSFWFTHPASLQKLKGGIDDTEFTRDFRSRIHIPERYGPTQTYSSSNESVLPDEYLRTWQMAFLIRHPVLAWSSLYRAVLKIADELGLTEEQFRSATSVWNMTYNWTRSLFDWSMEQPDSAQTVRQAGNRVKFEWSKNNNNAVNVPKAEQSRRERLGPIMLSTLNGSAGAIKYKAPGCIDISAEASKWTVEFGEQAARFLEKAVVDSMPDYEYLKSHRMTL